MPQPPLCHVWLPRNCPDRRLKKFLLMQLSIVKNYDELGAQLPDLTRYQYTSARKSVLQTGLTALPADTYVNVKRSRRDLDSVTNFVNFFAKFVVDVSHGATPVTLSTGEVITVQKAVQEIPTDVIIKLYKLHYREEKDKFEEEAGIAYPIKLFCDTVLRDIAKTIPLGELKSLRDFSNITGHN